MASDLECQYCGKECGNKGGKTTHERHCEYNPTNQEQPQQQVQQQPQQPPPQQTQPPAQQQQETGVAQHNQRESIALGAEIGETGADLMTGDPEMKAKAQAELTDIVGASLIQLGRKTAERKLEQIREAKSSSTSDFRVAREYPSCPECGRQITEVPVGNEHFQCRNCGAILERKPREDR